MRYLSIAFLALSLIASAQNPKKDKLVKIKTSFGEMTVVLFDETPLHKANFLALAESGQYDSTVFHRVINEFMVQGGDIYRKPNAIQGSDDDRLPAEFVPEFFHHKGALAAARTNNPEKKSSSCQFYFVHGKVYDEDELTIDQNKLNQTFAKLLQEGKIDTIRNQLIELQKEKKFDEMNNLIANSCDYLEEISGDTLRKNISPERVKAYTTIGGSPHLDDEYTVFGKVLDGLEVVDKIAAVETKRGDAPVEDIYMTMEVIELSKKKITKLYGHPYPKK
jgi:peptidyl-prolyl cis-trans isomerase B (cyclophilin B)